MTSDLIKRQRTVPSAKAYEFVWVRPVAEELKFGAFCDRYDEENCVLEMDCFIRVDEYGFFIQWKREGQDAQLIELTQVSDVRNGVRPKDEKICSTLMESSNDDCLLDQRICTVISGLDMVNVSYTHFVFKTANIASFWIEKLTYLTNNMKQYNVCPMTQLKKHWMRMTLSLNYNGKIPVRVISKTIASGRTEKALLQIFKEVDLPSGKNDEIDAGVFTFDKFNELYMRICPRRDIEVLFQKLSGNELADRLPSEKMIAFLNKDQRDPRLNEILYPFANANTIKHIIMKNEQNPTNRQDLNFISKDCFYRYLMSDDNAPVFLDRLDVVQDMDQPMPHYYINSSHNTYLSGRQFGGRSSVEMYRQVLLSGCRCIELDCWDGRGEDQEPIITHGKAMCTDILFRDVIYAIRDTAFVTSTYPVILSFENHCSKAQQYKLAKYSEDILGDLLLSKPIEKHALEPGVPLPSPEKLRYKIIIKNKRLKPDVEKLQLDHFMRGQKDLDEEEDASAVDGEAPDFDYSQKNRKNDTDAHPSDEAVLFGGADAALATYTYTGATTNIHPYLSQLVCYAQPVKFQGFSHAEHKNQHFHMSSFNETVALTLLKYEAIDFVNYNKRQFSRIYPRGNRVDSSNFTPQVFWNAGCQMVSLNFQTSDLWMQVNMGKFEYNGSCGYLLKPEFMRRSERIFDPFTESSMDGIIAATCEVEVISGQFLSDKKIGTYVEVDMHGLPTDTIRKEFRTRIVQANGLNPNYETSGVDSKFVFRKIVLPDLAIMRIAVYEETGKLIGQRVLPFDGLQAGYRHISLRSEGNFPLPLATIFCKITLSTYVPEGLMELADALSDPRAHLNKPDKNVDAMSSMGVWDDMPASFNNLNCNNDFKQQLVRGGGSSSSTTVVVLSNPQQSEVGTSSVPCSSTKVEFIPITYSMLKSSKTHVKLTKKCDKDLASLLKTHEKRNATMLRSQTNATDKVNASANYDRKGTINYSSNSNATNNLSDMQRMVTEHTEEWTNLKMKHLKEQYDMKMNYCNLMHEHDLKHLKELQDTQKKDLRQQQERAKNHIKKEQAKGSVGAVKKMKNTIDPQIKTKADVDRRTREMNYCNTKIFIEERKSQAQKQEKQLNDLIKKHDDEEREVKSVINREMDEISRLYQESVLSAKKTSVI